jgi:hypothetical protein
MEVTNYDSARLKWRSENTVIGGSKIAIMTYDDLLDWLDGRLTLLNRLGDSNTDQNNS